MAKAAGVAVPMPSGRSASRSSRRPIKSREAYPIYDKWFVRPIPPHNVAREQPMDYLLKDFWKHPSHWVPN